MEIRGPMEDIIQPPSGTVFMVSTYLGLAAIKKQETSNMV
jgi:hypothetical protein